jgi:hypothetical protein
MRARIFTVPAVGDRPSKARQSRVLAITAAWPSPKKDRCLQQMRACFSKPSGRAEKIKNLAYNNIRTVRRTREHAYKSNWQMITCTDKDRAWAPEADSPGSFMEAAHAASPSPAASPRTDLSAILHMNKSKCFCPDLASMRTCMVFFTYESLCYLRFRV